MRYQACRKQKQKFCCYIEMSGSFEQRAGPFPFKCWSQMETLGPPTITLLVNVFPKQTLLYACKNKIIKADGSMHQRVV
jgi:hypothetical protein